MFISRFLPPVFTKRCREVIRTARKPTLLYKNPKFELNTSLDLVLSHYCRTHDDVKFLQVGAFDGMKGDPLFPLIEEYPLSGALIEPQPEPFQRLISNYSKFDQSRFTFVNAAISPQDGFLPLYKVTAGPGDPPWLPQLASFDRNVILKMRRHIKDCAARIYATEVRSLTFDSLFAELKTERVDLLQIDAEGYDSEVLRLFDVPRRTPAIIRFEHRFMTRPEHASWIGMLTGLGYKIALEPQDTLAYKVDPTREQ
jgi:FkbM family methyltransferase